MFQMKPADLNEIYTTFRSYKTMPFQWAVSEEVDSSILPSSKMWISLYFTGMKPN